MLDEPKREGVVDTGLDSPSRIRLLGRYGSLASRIVDVAGSDEFQPIESTTTLWAELRWAAHAEGVVHLDDLLLRRVRLGLNTPQGGISLLERIREMVQPELGWEDARWDKEAEAYIKLWHQSYALPTMRQPSKQR